MKLFRFSLLVVVVGFLLTACASPRFFVDPNWQTLPESTSVKVIFTVPEIKDPQMLQRALPEYNVDFSKWFVLQAKEYFTKKTGDKVTYSFRRVDNETIMANKVSLGDKPFDAPFYTQISDEATIYLVLSDIRTGTYSNSFPNMNGGPAITTISIMINCKYAFYDGKTKKLLAYGKAFGDGLGTRTSNWALAMSDLVDKIAYHTPMN